MAKRPLTKKQELFIQEYLRCDNASEAYRIAYNTKKMKLSTIHRKAKECMDNGKITASINAIKEEIQKKIARKYEVTFERLTKEYARVSFLDMRIFFKSDGSLIPIHELSSDAAAALSVFEIVKTGAGEDVEYLKKIKTYDKLKALGDLGKHLGFFKEDNDQKKISNIVITRTIVDPKEDDNPDA